MSLDILNYFASRSVKADCKYCQKFKTYKAEFDIKVFLHLIKN